MKFAFGRAGAALRRFSGRSLSVIQPIQSMAALPEIEIIPNLPARHFVGMKAQPLILWSPALLARAVLHRGLVVQPGETAKLS
ncbi:MAG TPA: hypothetical protein VMU31_00565 [Rhizomicrobium sp.]|nr:hypothetical protein [Rhizomicrobium sp.]